MSLNYLYFPLYSVIFLNKYNVNWVGRFIIMILSAFISWKLQASYPVGTSVQFYVISVIYPKQKVAVQAAG
jgi:hypothetical protein